MKILPVLTAFIAGTMGWALGKAVEGRFTAILLSMIGAVLGFYYGRKYVKGLMG